MEPSSSTRRQSRASPWRRLTASLEAEAKVWSLTSPRDLPRTTQRSRSSRREGDVGRVGGDAGMIVNLTEGDVGRVGGDVGLSVRLTEGDVGIGRGEVGPAGGDVGLIVN